MGRRWMVLGVLAGVLVGAAAGCGGDGDDGGGGASATTTTPETTSAPGTTAGGGTDDEIQLTASGFAWDKTELQMAAGREVKVEVTNDDSAPHSFTFQAASVDQTVDGGEDASVTFTAPAAGDYPFRCKFHASMTGMVTVT